MAQRPAPLPRLTAMPSAAPVQRLATDIRVTINRSADVLAALDDVDAACAAREGKKLGRSAIIRALALGVRPAATWLGEQRSERGITEALTGALADAEHRADERHR